MRKILTIFVVGAFSLLFGEQINVKIGSENSYKPFTYIDENGVSTGYDNDVVRLLAKIDGKMSLEFIPVPWNSIFVGLDAAKFDLIANQISKTPQREEKYIFSKEPYFYGKSVLIARDGSDINSAFDLKNRAIGTTVGSNHSENIESFAKQNPELNIKIKYYKNHLSILNDLAAGRIDAMINDPLVALDLAKKQNISIKVTEYIFSQTPVYLLFKKTDKALKERFDAALAKAKQGKELSELSIKYFGIDLSK